MEIKFFNKGGLYPYQAEGKIGDLYFYFRYRHDNASLTLFNTGEDLDELENEVGYESMPYHGDMNDKIAEEIINKLYKKHEEISTYREDN